MLHIEGRLKGFIHEIVYILLVHPGSTKTHINLRSFQIFGLRCLKRLNIDIKIWRHFRSVFRFPQFLTDIARQIFVRCYISGPSILIQRSRNLKDHTGQLISNLILFQTGQLCHERQIHTRFFRNGHSKRLCRCVHMRHRGTMTNCAFGEHVSFPFQFTFLVHNFE